jgi:hypothetical protein
MGTKTHISSRRDRWNVGIPKGFPKSVGRVGSRHHGFPCFPYSVISMVCFCLALLDQRLRHPAQRANAPRNTYHDKLSVSALATWINRETCAGDCRLLTAFHITHQRSLWTASRSLGRRSGSGPTLGGTPPKTLPSISRAAQPCISLWADDMAGPGKHCTASFATK